MVSKFDLPPGKFEPPKTMIDENLDLSASLFDQHTLFSQILTMKFFDRIKDIKPGFLGTKNYITFGGY